MGKTTREVFEVGDRVVCDVCDKDMTESNESGGFLFGSYAYCPVCAATHLERIKGYHEESHIKAHCPSGLSFADWVRRMRWSSGNDKIIITTKEP